jgi:hypothetical protein
MAEEKTVRRLEIHLPDGALLATLIISEIITAKPAEPKKDEPQPAGKGNGGKNGDDGMSDAQKRYLFRLLADQGIENDAALEELKKRFKVSSLQEVSKVDASREINKLVTSQKGGESHAH